MSQTKNEVVILLGANLGDRKAMFSQVKTYITEHIGDRLKESAIYASKAWGFASNNEFYNQVIVVETEFSAHDVLLRCQAIENHCGRTREKGNEYEDRTIDIDLLYFNNDIVDTDDLIVPHPFLQERRFTLEPLCEIMPDYVHPIFLKTNAQMLKECRDKGNVTRV